MEIIQPRMEIIQPRVARSELPWEHRRQFLFTLKGLHQGHEPRLVVRPGFAHSYDRLLVGPVRAQLPPYHSPPPRFPYFPFSHRSPAACPSVPALAATVCATIPR